MKVFESLEQLKQKGPSECSWGICGNLESYETDQTRSAWLEQHVKCFRAWDEFSGHDAYPVPLAGCHPSFAFCESDDENMWNPDHPYGAARLRCLDHCINWFKEKDV